MKICLFFSLDESVFNYRFHFLIFFHCFDIDYSSSVRLYVHSSEFLWSMNDKCLCPCTSLSFFFSSSPLLLSVTLFLSISPPLLSCSLYLSFLLSFFSLLLSSLYLSLSTSLSLSHTLSFSLYVPLSFTLFLSPSILLFSFLYF